MNKRFRTPNNALIAGGAVGLIALYTGTTDKVIIISALGAVVMYCISMVSLLVVRKKALIEQASFKTPFYPWFPLIALLLSFVCLVAIAWYNAVLAGIFLGGLGVALIIFIAMKKHKSLNDDQTMYTAADI